MRQRLLFMLEIAILTFCIIAAAGCLHDNAVTQRRLETMGADLAAMRQRQERQASEVRQIKTDGEIMLRVVNEKVFIEEAEK